ncbi:helix-turn-helix domain-containing protein [Paenibacillus luteus]|uniref:helix-turn-helix domain-containing protein n=1 Tax=Paenibacillus luteus TaxID=2545753 RepID=UPI0011417E3D|nr:helix-turn-helix domain-containing protein [Paenibacillus luteus]
MSKLKMILVEDEFPARTVFRLMLEETQRSLCELVGEAADGREGLELYWKHKPQIIVTDITMPGMNGLTMLDEIERSGETMPQIVILTCHQDFHYAREAIRFKVASYLLKDDCLSNSALLPQTIDRLCRQMEIQDRTREEQLLIDQRLRSNILEIERNLFLDMQRSSVAKTGLLRILQQSSLCIERTEFHVFLLDLDIDSSLFRDKKQEDLKLWQFAGVNVLSELLDGVGVNKTIAMEKGRFLAIFQSTVLRDSSILREQIRHAFLTFLKIDVFVLHCVFDQNIAQQTSELIRLAVARYPFFYSNSAHSDFANWEKNNHYAPMPETRRSVWLKALKQALLECHLTSVPVEQTSSALLREAKQNHWEPEHIKSLYYRIFLDSTQFAAEPDGLTDNEAEFRSKLDQSRTYRAVYESIVACFRKLHDRRSIDEKHIDSSIIHLIQRIYEDLSYPYKLQELAASINYSVPYFSSMFKKITGESFIPYLTRLRIEKAQLLLLTTDLKTFEIAEAVGLENYRSFNRMFKKETGMSPSDFRNAGQTLSQT